MNIWNHLEEIRIDRPSFVAVGCFDGVHLAHQKILRHICSDPALIPTVITFSDIGQIKQSAHLMTEEEKIRLLGELGVKTVLSLDFQEIRDMTADHFVQNVLRRQCLAERVCCGYDFRFGKGGKADAKDLAEMGKICGFETDIIDKMIIDGETVSSTLIRSLIRDGKMEHVAKLLGRAFSIDETVRHGRQIGRKIGIPTMNQELPEGMIRPKQGVYCSRVQTKDRIYPGVTNIGMNPTVQGNHLTVETWIQDFDGNLYDRKVRVELLSYLREEVRFDSLEDLQKQILLDREQALRIYDRY